MRRREVETEAFPAANGLASLMHSAANNKEILVGSENQHLRLFPDHMHATPPNTMHIEFSRVLYQLTGLNRKAKLFNFTMDCVYFTAFAGGRHKWKAILTLRSEHVGPVCGLTLSVIDNQGVSKLNCPLRA